MKVCPPTASAHLDQFLDGVKDLPPSPTLMLELMSLLKQPDRDIDQLIDIMSHDPSLTAEVLRRCNSGFFANGDPATDIFEATFRLGFHEVYQIATALFGTRLLSSPGSKGGFNLESVWEHSAITGVIAGALAKEAGENEGLAFTGGLLHDLGKVVFVCAKPVEYARVLERAESGEDLLALEEELFGFDHMTVGGRLLSRWKFPAEIVGPVEHHHCPLEAVEEQCLGAILNLADACAYGLVNGTDPQFAISESTKVSCELLQIKPDHLAALLEEAHQSAERICSLFHSKRPERASSPVRV